MTATPAPPSTRPRRSYRYYDLVMAAFRHRAAVRRRHQSAAKVAKVGPFTFGAASFFFPISYVFGDVLTEVLRLRPGPPRSCGPASGPSPSPRS